jgi:hypothetical protein
MRGVATLLGPKPLEQSRDHFLDFEKFDLSFLVPVDFKHSKVAGEKKKVLKFAGGSHGNMQELSKFSAAPSAATFRDVCRYGTGRAPDLAAEAKSLVWRKFAGNFVRLKCQFMTSAPNLQLAEILHDLASLNCFKPLSNYLQLTTNNRQLCREGYRAD